MYLLARLGIRRRLPRPPAWHRFAMRVQYVAAGSVDGREQTGSQRGHREGRGLGGRFVGYRRDHRDRGHRPGGTQRIILRT